MSLIRYWRDLAHHRHASRELLIAYPNAKVILTTRSPDKWIEPVERSTYAEALTFRQLVLSALTDWSGGRPEDRTFLREEFVAYNENI
ncbi:predicted protein [Botrytis cinerea T4]|uniref:Uncharacterized protein n=1 Tax=Botryotinia fuckeliana (strain T4) TaxID=999810 RepID=G2YZI5_BOTF4|nr:predicted protein [Botrytis cinerea T4]